MAFLMDGPLKPLPPDKDNDKNKTPGPENPGVYLLVFIALALLVFIAPFS